MTGSTTPPPHAPEAGRMQKLLGRFHVTGVFWYKILNFGVSILPRGAWYPIVLAFTLFFFVFLFKIRRAIASNLSAALGPCGWLETQRRIFRTMWEFAWCFLERNESMSGTRQVSFAVDGETIWNDVASSSSGFITLTAHIGNWESGSRVPSKKSDRTVHLVREEEVDPRAQDFIRQMIEDRVQDITFKVHFAAKGDPSLGAELLNALRDGDIVALQGDRPRSGGRAVKVSLFGRPFDLPAGPAALARAASVPLMPVFVFREARLQSRIVIRDVIEVGRSADRRGDVNSALEKVAANLEWAIHERPHQWFCFRELWPPETTR
jgi:lauroyl/myristoyl acyltransferase